MPAEVWQIIIKNRTKDQIFSDIVHPEWYSQFVFNQTLYGITLENYATNLAEKMVELLSYAIAETISLEILANESSPVLCKVKAYLDIVRLENPEITRDKFIDLYGKKMQEIIKEEGDALEITLNNLAVSFIAKIIKSSSFRSIAASAELFFNSPLRDIVLKIDQTIEDRNMRIISQLNALGCSIESHLFSYTPKQIFFKNFYNLLKYKQSLQDEMQIDPIIASAIDNMRLVITKSLIISRNHFDQSNGLHHHYEMFFLMNVIEFSSIDDLILFINKQMSSKYLASNLLIALILANFKSRYGIDIYQNLPENTFLDFEQKLKELLLNNPVFVERNYTEQQVDTALANLKTLRGEDLFSLLKDFFLLSDSNLKKAKLIAAIATDGKKIDYIGYRIISYPF